VNFQNAFAHLMVLNSNIAIRLSATLRTTTGVCCKAIPDQFEANQLPDGLSYI
jgi:hypothetical protein